MKKRWKVTGYEMVPRVRMVRAVSAEQALDQISAKFGREDRQMADTYHVEELPSRNNQSTTE